MKNIKIRILTYIITQLFELLDQLLLLESRHPSKNNSFGDYFRHQSWEGIDQISPRITSDGETIRFISTILNIGTITIIIHFLFLKVKGRAN